MKRHKHAPDFILLITTLLLLIFGIVMVYSASEYVSRYATKTDANPDGYNYYYARRQLMWAILGIAVMLAMMNFDYWHLARLAKPGYLLTIILLVLVLIPGIGEERFGAKRWLGVGKKMTIQPSEIGKLSVAIFLSRWLAGRGDQIKSFVKGLLPPLVYACIICGLVVMQPDLGTAILIFGIAGVLIFVAGAQWKHIAILLVVAAIGVTGLILSSDYRSHRFSFINPWQDPAGDGFQLIQSYYALGPGGLFGRGLAQSLQKQFYLPFPHTDFILAIIGEELGFLGTSLVVVLFAVLVWRGYRIGINAPDPFGCLLAVGMTAMVGLQAIVNVAVVTGSIPTTGIPLPLISAGGSSLVFTLAAIGILLNVSRYARE